MTTQDIFESGMTFGPYPEGQCFHIEKSKCYQGIQDGVKMAEFLLLRQRDEGKAPVVWVVEAKSSSPKPRTVPDFADFVDEVRSKLTNAFMLCVSSCLQRHSVGLDELPGAFRTLDLQNSNFLFVLVVNGHKEEWLPPLQDALKQVLNPLVKTWALPPSSVVVWNHDLAREYGLILPVAVNQC